MPAQTMFELLLKELGDAAAASKIVEGTISDSVSMMALMSQSIKKAQDDLAQSAINLKDLSTELSDLTVGFNNLKKENADLSTRLTLSGSQLTAFSAKLKLLADSKDIIFTPKAIAALLEFDKTIF